MRRRRGGKAVVATLVALVAAAFLFLTRPSRLPASLIPPHRPDLANGQVLFRAGSCMACHRPPEGRAGADRDLPSGGEAFKTPIGTFYPQNLTPDPETGLGRWSAADFVNAMTRGVSPDGEHYFPAFPYPSYRFLRMEDVLDLRGYLMSLPAVRSPDQPASVPLIGLARRAVGLWKRLALGGKPFRPDPGKDASWNRGAYLVKAPGHCGECHTPRNWLFAPDRSRTLAGGPHPSGEGKVPSLRVLVARHRYKDAADLVLALQYGETLGYDKLSSGGMSRIQESLSHLPQSDLRAIADYLVSLN